MTATYVEAKDEMLQLLRSRIRDTVDGAASIIGYIPAVYYPGGIVEDRPAGAPDDKPLQDKYYIRILLNTLGSDQGTLSNCVGKVGHRRYESYGLIEVQLYGPSSENRSSHILALVGQNIRTVLRRVPTQKVVRFRKATLDDTVGREGQFNRLNVVAEFEYDTIE